MSEKIPEGNDRYGLHRNERNSSAKSLWCVIGLGKSQEHQETFFSMEHHYAWGLLKESIFFLLRWENWGSE